MRDHDEIYGERDAYDQYGATVRSVAPPAISSQTAAKRRTAAPVRLSDGPNSDAGVRTATARRHRVSNPHGTDPHHPTLDPQRTTSHQRATRSPRRNVTTARPVRSEDTALVEYTTRMLEAITVVEPVTLEDVAREQQALAPLHDDSPTGPAPVTLVPAGTTGKMHHILPVIPRPGKHRLRNSVIVWMLALVTVITLVLTVRPLSHTSIMTVFRSQGAPYAAGSSKPGPDGPWATYAETHNVLGNGGGAGPGVKAPGSAGLPVKSTNPQPASSSSSVGGTGVLPAPLSPWPPSNPYMYVPGHPAFAMTDVNNYYYWAFGQCTWWAQYKRQDENLTRMGNAQYWASGAAARGYRVGSAPAAGATVVFQPGVQGAGGAGHVAHVEAVYPQGWFLISEMNFYWNGGGWGRVDYRYVHTGWGVQFIY